MEEIAHQVDVDAAWVLKQLVDTYYTARWRDDLSAANKSLELIGRHLGMFKERLEVTTPFIERLMAMSDAELAKLEEEERAKLVPKPSDGSATKH